MMTAPIVDQRTREDVEAGVRRLMSRFVGGWPRRSTGDASDALIGVFAQLCGTIIDRLNKAPGKNLLAFLDMLGANLLPAQAARAPLTFHLAVQHTGHVVVPAGTQVAATLEKGETQPVVFETEREMVVTSARLVATGVKEGPADKYDDYSSILEQPRKQGVPMFHGSQLIDHQLFIDLALPSPDLVIQELRLSIELENPIQPPGRDWLRWEIWDANLKLAVVLNPASDDTQELTKSGDIVFHSIPPVPQSELYGSVGYWLRCRTLLPLTSSSIPSVRRVTVTVESARQNLPVEAALMNRALLDPTKDFFPFGQHPAFGDTLYLANKDAFSKAGATVTMDTLLTNPETGASQASIPSVVGHNVRLRWEIWDGANWATAGVSESGRNNQDEATGFSDSTRAFTTSGAISIRVPPTTGPLQMGGRKSFWIRARLADGEYGRRGGYAKGRDGVYVYTPDSLTPPAISAISISYRLRLTSTPNMKTYNDFIFSNVNPQTGPFRPFQPSLEPASCYFGFLPAKPPAALASAAQKNFSDRSMSIYFGVGNPPDRKAVLDMCNAAQVTLIWEYWNGSEWTKWTVIDDTDGFRRSGIIRLLAPRDFASKSEFGKPAYWIRIRAASVVGYVPRLRLVLLNTTMASHTVTMTAEILGSGNGTPSQTFRTTKSPVLAGQQLEVLEPAMPSVEAQRFIREEEGEDAIHLADPSQFLGGTVWVRWHEVPNFNGSNRHDRHYVIERATGLVTFGDGVNGKIPPALTRNIVMARYQTGGGAVGNRKANSIGQLKTAIPYVDSVTNVEPATGGADAEDTARLLDRAPRQLRHGYRAVTPQDFEDLAMLASPGVARARCVPLYDLAQDPDATRARPGVVSLIIAPVAAVSVPLTTRPMPSMELIRVIKDYLDDRRLTEADLVIVGPDYVAIQVEAEFTVSDVDTASEVELAVSLALSQFLHPALGGKEGAGWNFGAEPNRSDIIALIQAVDGVDHVRELKMTQLEDRPGAHKSGYFQICAADPKTTATLEK